MENNNFQNLIIGQWAPNISNSHSGFSLKFPTCFYQHLCYHVQGSVIEPPNQSSLKWQYKLKNCEITNREALMILGDILYNTCHSRQHRGLYWIADFLHFYFLVLITVFYWVRFQKKPLLESLYVVNVLHRLTSYSLRLPRAFKLLGIFDLSFIHRDYH